MKPQLIVAALAILVSGCASLPPENQKPIVNNLPTEHFQTLEDFAKQQREERIQRARDYCEKHSDTQPDILLCFVNNTIKVGMSPEQVEVIKGFDKGCKFSRVQSDGVDGHIDILTYSYGEYGELGTEIYWFGDGKLVRWVK